MRRRRKSEADIEIDRYPEVRMEETERERELRARERMF